MLKTKQAWELESQLGEMLRQAEKEKEQKQHQQAQELEEQKNSFGDKLQALMDDYGISPSETACVARIIAEEESTPRPSRQSELH